jgi:homocysteine S-methyltransferase
MSFTCRDGERLWDGSAIEDAVGVCAEDVGMVAVGVNCTAPVFVESLVRRVRAVTALPIIAYPNSGEVYDPSSRTWSGRAAGREWLDRVPAWVGAGARVIGGCCRVGPDVIHQLRGRLEMSVSQGRSGTGG